MGYQISGYRLDFYGLFDPTRPAKSMNEVILDLEPWF
jgi:hypothetical protein